ncbi:MAG: hypothetical protein IPL61_08305 [Myxococcales bacterium]|nr:hypothetical protein [Myxococcales bacterium]
MGRASHLIIGLLATAVLASTACTSDDGDWVVRPPGNGTGTNGRADAGVDSGPTGDANATLVGVVCVVDDLRAPDVCPTVPAAAGVLVRRLGELTGVDSNAVGAFSLPVADPIELIEVAVGSTALVPALVPVQNDGAVVHTPTPTVTAWADALADVGASVSDGHGSIALYVETAAGAPASGVVFTQPAGGSLPPFYDLAGVQAWASGGGTGPAGAVLFVDLLPATYSLTGLAPGGAVVSPSVQVIADTITFVRVALP